MPVLARYQDGLLAAAGFAGSALVCGGTETGRRNITTPLVRSLDGGAGLPRLDTSRLRATWLADCGELLGLAAFMRAAGISCSQRLGDLVPAWSRAARSRPWPCWGPPGHDRAAGAGGVIDASGIAPRIEALLPVRRPAPAADRPDPAAGHAARPRRRPARAPDQGAPGPDRLPEGEQRRLGVLADWKDGPHRLTYRQAEYTFSLVTAALGKDQPDGLPSPALQAACDGLLEASIPGQFKDACRSLAVDWSDLETFSRPPPRGTGDCADPEASWGHRKNNLRHDEDELFFGYYLSAAVMVPDEQGPPVPELARRMTLSSCRHDPVPAFTPVLTAMPADGIPLGDVLADSGYSHRVPGNWASPLRQAGAALVQDLHPHDRGPRGTHQGAVIANGNLYCPAAPRTLLELGPLARAATPEQAARHDAKTAEAARCKLGRLTRDDEDGYHRVQCPAAAGKVRCPLRPAVDDPGPRPPRDPHPAGASPGLLHPADHHHPAGVLAKTAQKHDYPSAAWRRSYARRSGAERGFATAKDPASNDIARGWCRLIGLAPLMLFTATLLAARNHRILAAWNARQDENARRAAKGLPPKTRRRRRKSPAMAAAARPDSRPTRTTARSPAPHGASLPSHARQQPATAKRRPGALEPARPGPGPPSRPECQTQT